MTDTPDDLTESARTWRERYIKAELRIDDLAAEMERLRAELAEALGGWEACSESLVASKAEVERLEASQAAVTDPGRPR